MRQSVEGTSRRYSTVLDHQSKQAFFLRTNPVTQLKDLYDLKLLIQSKTPQPTAFSVYNILKQRYSKAILVSPAPSIRAQTQRSSTERMTTRQGSLTTRSTYFKRTPTPTPKSALFKTPKVTRRSKVSRLSKKLSNINTQCNALQSGLKTERIDTDALRRAAAAEIGEVRESLELKIEESGRHSLPASFLALRSRRTHSQPELDSKVNLEVAENLRQYKQHLWSNAVKLSLNKEMRYVYTMGTCTVLPENSPSPNTLFRYYRA